MGIELSVLTICARTVCVSKWVIRTVLREEAGGVGSGNSGTVIPEILARSVLVGKISSKLR